MAKNSTQSEGSQWKYQNKESRKTRKKNFTNIMLLNQFKESNNRHAIAVSKNKREIVQCTTRTWFVFTLPEIFYNQYTRPVFWRLWRQSLKFKSLTALKNLSLILHSEPNFLATRVMFSLVCESKAGFSIRQLTNTQMWFLICNQDGKQNIFLDQGSKLTLDRRPQAGVFSKHWASKLTTGQVRWSCVKNQTRGESHCCPHLRRQVEMMAFRPFGNTSAIHWSIRLCPRRTCEQDHGVSPMPYAQLSLVC